MCASVLGGGHLPLRGLRKGCRHREISTSPPHYFRRFGLPQRLMKSLGHSPRLQTHSLHLDSPSPDARAFISAGNPFTCSLFTHVSEWEGQ